MVSMGIFGKEKIQSVLTCSVKKVFLEIWQNSQKSTGARASFNKVAGFRPATLLKKKRPLHKCFSVNFVKFLRTTSYTEHVWWLLLKGEELAITVQVSKVNKVQRHSFAHVIQNNCS